MLELTEQQVQALENPEDLPPRVVNPRTKQTFVLLRVYDYERLKEEEYDDSPWTKEELQSLAWEAVKQIAQPPRTCGRDARVPSLKIGQREVTRIVTDRI